ncbi:MAG: FAD-dependent oxidoreductase [Parcubacteria group bacterium]|nr:FAD-dependent oxidoreductase [Parcubacteria group bacterium]
MAIPQTSTWVSDTKLPQFPKLKEDISTEVLVIGGGLAGLLSAYLLAKAKKEVVVIEKGRLSQMGTGYTTGFLSQIVDTDYSDLIDMFGKKGAKDVWNSHGKAIDLIERIVEDEEIDCEFNRCNNYIYANSRSEWRDLKTEYEAMRTLGFSVTDTPTDLGFSNKGVITVENQGKYHAVKFVAGLVQALERMGVQIFELTEAKEHSKGKGLAKVSAGKYTIAADWTITATYQPFDNPKEVFLKKGMYKSYIIELEAPKGSYPEGTYEDADNPYQYFRVDRMHEHDRIILGGMDHRAELKFSEERIFSELENYAEELFGERYKLVREWSGYILEPLDGLAYIGQVAPRRLLATAFSGNGMTYSAISAMIFRDIIGGKKNPYAGLYEPSRVPNMTQLWKKGRDYTEELFRGVAKIATKGS